MSGTTITRHRIMVLSMWTPFASITLGERNTGPRSCRGLEGDIPSDITSRPLELQNPERA